MCTTVMYEFIMNLRFILEFFSFLVYMSLHTDYLLLLSYNGSLNHESPHTAIYTYIACVEFAQRDRNVIEHLVENVLCIMYPQRPAISFFIFIDVLMTVLGKFSLENAMNSIRRLLSCILNNTSKKFFRLFYTNNCQKQHSRSLCAVSQVRRTIFFRNLLLASML